MLHDFYFSLMLFTVLSGSRNGRDDNSGCVNVKVLLLKRALTEYIHTNNLSTLAITIGDLGLLRYAYYHGFFIYDYTACEIAAEHGHIECLKFLRRVCGLSWDKFTFYAAAQHGQLECIKYLHENWCPWTSAVAVATVYGGYLNCLKYLYDNGCPVDERVMSYAAYYGHLDMLKYLHSAGCPWNENACLYAAESGHLDCLKFLHSSGCPWNYLTLKYAISERYYDCARYAFENGCPVIYEERLDENGWRRRRSRRVRNFFRRLRIKFILFCRT